MSLYLESDEGKVNPWLSMWIKPRETVRTYLEENRDKWILLLVALLGVKEMLDQTAGQSAGEMVPLTVILLVALVFGPIAGFIQWYLFSLGVMFAGRLLGGEASYQEVKTGIALSFVPAVWGLALWIPELILFGREMFTEATPTIEASLVLSILFLFFILIEFVVFIWYLVTLCLCVAEVFQFSGWKGFGTVLLAVGFLLLFLVPIVLIIHSVIGS